MITDIDRGSNAHSPLDKRKKESQTSWHFLKVIKRKTEDASNVSTHVYEETSENLRTTTINKRLPEKKQNRFDGALKD